MKEREIQRLWIENGNNIPVSDDFRAGCLAAAALSDDNKAEICARSSIEHKRIIEVLVAAGFVTDEKIEQARELVQGFSR